MTAGQAMALEQLREIEAAPDSPLEIISFAEQKNGRLAVYISVDCSTVPQSPEGMPLRNREKLKIYVPSDFPFSHPLLYSTHRRWEGFPHVYWATYLCLYQAPDTEWNPSDGMFGFVARIDTFLRDAALGRLEPVGAALHPPTTPDAGRYDLPTIVPQANAPTVSDQPWFGFALIRQVSERRIDIDGWESLFADVWPTTPVAPALLLAEPLSHLFPDTIGKLISELSVRGISRSHLLAIICCGLDMTPSDTPLILVIGAPMRGTKGHQDLKQHLTAWYFDPETAGALRLTMPRPTDNEELRQIRADLEEALLKALAPCPIHWCPVLEARPEIIVRRDVKTSMNWFIGKQVTVWGCGAIGAQLAEALVRAGIDRLVLYDDGIIKPGVLVRQPYEDRDIGFPKAEILKRRLLAIRPSLNVEAHVGDVKRLAFGRSDWHDNADLVIDATASRSVLTKLELRRKADFSPVPIASFVIGPKARRGLLIVTGRGHSGGPFDAARAAKLQLLRSFPSSPYLSDFFPLTSHEHFQPEPGCSEPTFVGSFADVAVLSHSMLNALPEALTSIHNSEAAICFCSQPTNSKVDPTIRLRVAGRIISHDPQTGFEVRISDEAWAKMHSAIDRSAWKHGRRVETGGIVLGEKDEVLKIIWVDEMSGPPKDSVLTEAEFICGVDGTAALHKRRDLESRGSIRYLGMWHTHPDSAPLPSRTDMTAMSSLSKQTGASNAHVLMMIIGTPYQGLCLATYVFSRREILSNAVVRTCALLFPPSLFGLAERRQSVLHTLIAGMRGIVDRLRHQKIRGFATTQDELLQ